jgi:dUTP pyrophosphatase
MYLVAVLDNECYPERAHFTDAGLDLVAREEVTLLPTEAKGVKMGIKVEIPPGYVGLIFPRSGLATKKRITLTNTVGVIDADYRGEIICHVINNGSFQYTVHRGDRIAQLVVLPCLIGDIFTVQESDLSNTERGENGFGHTGGN